MEKDCGAWINLLSHRLKVRLDASFQDLGITGVQSRVIFYILAHCGEGPVFQRDIENVFALSRSTATGILQVLEKNGMIRRERVAGGRPAEEPGAHAARRASWTHRCATACGKPTGC